TCDARRVARARSPIGVGERGPRQNVGRRSLGERVRPADRGRRGGTTRAERDLRRQPPWRRRRPALRALRRAAARRPGSYPRRAAATARSAALTLRRDFDSYAETFAPAIAVVDHRTLGTWSASGAEEFRQHWHAFFDLADVALPRDDDILALQPDALLVSRVFSGTDRASAGPYRTPGPLIIER